MVQQLVYPEDELARKAGAIRVLSLGMLAAASSGELIGVIIWLFNAEFLIIPLTLCIVAGVIISGGTYWLVKMGRVKAAGYFFVIGFLLEDTIIITMFGGYTGPLSITYLFPILAAGIVIGINASFVVATLASVLYLSLIGIERTHLIPQLIPSEPGSIIPYLTVGTVVIFFYLTAFLSWFAASRLNRALQAVRSYATELAKANEQLQVSEEELRVANEELQAGEEELRATNEELQAANEELKEAQEQLIRSEKLAVIGQLAGAVGHELRNPLGAIKNATYYIKGKLDRSELGQREPRVTEFLDIINDEITASNKIINDLLGFSRTRKPSVVPTRIEKVIDDTLSLIPLPENIELDRKPGTGLPEVKIDPDQIQQVLANVITNAVEAMPEGGRLTITASEVEKFLEMKITDTGSGIAPEIAGKIFDPLFTTKAKGIGLGLAVCKSIIERHEGNIEVNSEVGKGTTFTIRIPLAVEPALIKRQYGGTHGGN